jgi:hypothetical protein
LKQKPKSVIFMTDANSFPQWSGSPLWWCRISSHFFHHFPSKLAQYLTTHVYR